MCVPHLRVCVSLSAWGRYNNAAHSQPVGEQEVNLGHWLQSLYRLCFNDGGRWGSQDGGGVAEGEDTWRAGGREREKEWEGLWGTESHRVRLWLFMDLTERQRHLRTKRGRSSKHLKKKQQLPQPRTHSHPCSYSAYCISNISERIYMFS